MTETSKPNAEVEEYMRLLLDVACALNKLGARMVTGMTMHQVEQMAAKRALNWRTGTDATIDAYGEARVCLICISPDGREREEILHITISTPVANWT